MQCGFVVADMAFNLISEEDLKRVQQKNHPAKFWYISHPFADSQACLTNFNDIVLYQPSHRRLEMLEMLISCSRWYRQWIFNFKNKYASRERERARHTYKKLFQPFLIKVFHSLCCVWGWEGGNCLSVCICQPHHNRKRILKYSIMIINDDTDEN